MTAPRAVALVTGGARRIGAAIVTRLAAEGWRVVIHANSSLTEAEALAGRIRQAGGSASCVGADLRDGAAVAELVGEAARAFGPLTLLVNNASLFRVDTLQTVSGEQWEAHQAVNLRAPVFLARDFAAQAPAGSSIVNIVDQRVLKLTPQCFSYTLAKAALHAATTTMAQSLAPGIRVNAVGPGPTLPNPHDGEDGLRQEAAGIPLGRTIDPAEIAEAVLYLARATGVTGQTIAVDGGQHIGWRTPDVILP
jgi:NAD(P)-dependent dehydrogenase (short-subunit alcohol dehydrogenase family)